MGTLREVVHGVEGVLEALGYRRATANFSLEQAPASLGHRCYTFAEARIAPRYFAANIADYEGSALALLILWKAKGSHNASGSFQEAFLDLLDAWEELETALVKNQPGGAGENNLVTSALIAPLATENNQDWLVLSIDLNLDALRAL